jgi:Divergent InlB B-repeat domain
MVGAGTLHADAASLDASWTAPTTNADGSPLVDLAGYRLYLATATPTCPGPSFHSLGSSTGTPTPGQTIAYRISSLVAGTTYFTAITAVDGSGNESQCTTAVSAVARADVSVSPTASVNLGTTTTGTALDTTFTVQNPTASTVTAATTVSAPFSIVSGSSLTLAPGASQPVTVRFRSTTAGSFASNVTFTANGDTLSRTISATAVASPLTLSVTRAGTGTGTVTSAPTGITCGTDCTETVAPGTAMVLTAAAAAGSTFAGWSGGCTGTGTCAVTLNANATVTATFNVTPAPAPVASSLSPSTTVAGSSGFTLTVNGSGFAAASVVRWNGADRTTTYVSATQLKAAITSTDVATAGALPVAVYTPAPGGGTSGAQSFTITPVSAPAPAAVPSATEIIIDNAAAGVQDQTGGRTFTGKWCQADADNEYGGTSLRSCGRGGDTYRWTPRIVTAGAYDVYVWIPTHSVRSTAVPIVVAHGNGTTTKLFNERRAIGSWVLHGRYSFGVGTSGYVQTSDIFGRATADAVRLVPVQ